MSHDFVRGQSVAETCFSQYGPYSAQHIRLLRASLNDFFSIHHLSCLSCRQKTLSTVFYLSFIRPTEDASDWNFSSICHLSGRLKTLPSRNVIIFRVIVIKQADRRHFRLEVKFTFICHLSGRHNTLPTRN